MYALIYDEYKPEEREKRVISVHQSRETAEKALEKRHKDLGKRVWECNTRIVWVKDQVRAGDNITPDAFKTWASGERIPYGDLYSDTD
jgi:hypothetical protein